MPKQWCGSTVAFHGLQQPQLTSINSSIQHVSHIDGFPMFYWQFCTECLARATRTDKQGNKPQILKLLVDFPAFYPHTWQNSGGNWKENEVSSSPVLGEKHILSNIQKRWHLITSTAWKWYRNRTRTPDRAKHLNIFQQMNSYLAKE